MLYSRARIHCDLAQFRRGDYSCRWRKRRRRRRSERRHRWCSDRHITHQFSILDVLAVRIIFLEVLLLLLLLEVILFLLLDVLAFDVFVVRELVIHHVLIQS
jgi:hypothetical protein